MTSLKANGQTHTVDAPLDMPLLWVLRDLLGLTGTKFGCGYCQPGQGRRPDMSQGLRDAQNKVDGVTLNGAQELMINRLPAAYPMPKFSSVPTDRQVADVLTFVRSHWNNASTAVFASEVVKLREATAHALK